MVIVLICIMSVFAPAQAPIDQLDAEGSGTETRGEEVITKRLAHVATLDRGTSPNHLLGAPLEFSSLAFLPASCVRENTFDTTEAFLSSGANSSHGAEPYAVTHEVGQ